MNSYELSILNIKEKLAIDEEQQGKLQLQPYQLFTKFIVHPDRNYQRFLIKHGTGLGKTIEALSIARNFSQIGFNVFILSFNEDIFISDIIKFPELGFLSTETQQIQKQSGTTITKESKKEINNQLGIYGYKEFQNNLFWQDGNKYRVNWVFAKKLYKGLIICDEIHDVYNIEQQNTWGKTIQLISNYFKRSIHMLFMSATPLNNPEEINELINLMYLDNQSPNISEIQKNLQEVKLDNINDIKSPIYMDENDNENIILNIRTHLKEKISFVPESLKDNPVVFFKGQQYKEIQSLNFIQCFQNQQFEEYYQKHNYLSDEEWRKHLCFNFPNDNKLQTFINNYLKGEQTTIQWANENNISIKKEGQDYQIIGEFLQRQNINKYSPKFAQLINYLLKQEGKSFIYTNYVKNFGVDVIINLLRYNGFIMDGEIPKQDTLCFICRNTLKNHASYSSDKSQLKQQHRFVPYRYIAITGKTKQDNIKNIQKYNHPNNATGQHIQIVIGSKIIKQGFNILATNNVFIMSLPFNFANLIQVMGRCIRNKSHQNLEKDKQYVNVFIMITASQDSHNKTLQQFQDLYNYQQNSNQYGQITREELEYFIKAQKFKQIQQYEKIMHEVSIDPSLYGIRYFNQNDDYFQLDSDLKMVPFKSQINYKINDLDDNKELYQQYDLSNYYKQNIFDDIHDILQQIISYKFEQYVVWNINDLIENIRQNKRINFNNIDKATIYLSIINHENIQILDNYIIKTPKPLELDWFMPFQKNSIIKSIHLEQDQSKQAADPKQLINYLKDNIPDYYKSFKKFPLLIMPAKNIQLNVQKSQNLLKIIQTAFIGYNYKDLEQILIQSFQNKNIDLIACLFLLFHPITTNQVQSIEESQNRQQLEIIGFQNPFQQVAQILSASDDKNWIIKKIKLPQINQIHGLIDLKSLRIVQYKSGQLKDKRHQSQGIVCETVKKSQIHNIAKQLQIKTETKKKQELCSIIKNKLIQDELEFRLNNIYKKIAYFTFV